jgi:hypothetical protein
MTAHAKLGASNAHRWMVCPGSVSAEDGLPDQTSAFAQEGTDAHELAEQALRMAHLPPDHVEKRDWGKYADIKSNEYLDLLEDQAMADYVRVYTDYVNRLAVDCDTIDIEQRVSYADWVPGGFGTADAIIVKGDTLHVCDLKYGMGVRVDAEDNPQGMLYALGAWAATELVYDVDTVKIHIIQPRLDHISEWEISVDALLRWAELAKQCAEATQDENAVRVPGEKQCRFCKAKASCKALADYTESIIMADFDDLENMPKANTLTDDQMRVALEAKPLIEGWLSAIEAQVRDRLQSGGDFPGYKLVEGRSLRQWVDDPDTVETTLTDLLDQHAFVEPKLVSPSQAEKLLGKKNKSLIADLIVKPSGKPTLAPISDKRPAINLTDDDFDACADE